MEFSGITFLCQKATNVHDIRKNDPYNEHCNRGFNKHRRPTTDETRRIYCSKKSATFSPKEEATSWNNVMNKNRICSRENVRNKLIIICSLLVGVNCVANKSKFDLNPNLLGWKPRSFTLRVVL